MQKIYRIMDYVFDGISDSDAIDLCLRDAEKETGKKEILFEGKEFRINRAILVCDDTQITIDGCAIVQDDEVFDNVFRGKNMIVDPETPYGVPIDMTPLKNIKIIGKNGARITGTNKPKTGFHSVLKEEQPMNGDFWGWRTHMFSFSLCEDIEIAGLLLEKTMGWAISFDCGHDIYVHDLEIHSNVKNGDGIDFRSGCYNAIVENIFGYTSDDTVACTALATDSVVNYPIKNYLYTSEPFAALRREYNRDIHDIKIKNIRTGGLHHGVICLVAGGNKVFNISIEDVHETKEGNRESVVKIYTGYGSGYTAGDIHDITVKNVTSQRAKYAVQFVADVKNVSLEKIVQNNPDGLLMLGAENQETVTIS